MDELAQEYRETLSQIKQAIQSFPSHLAAEKPSRQALLLDRAARLKQVLGVGGDRPPAYWPSAAQQQAPPVAVEVKRAFAQQEWVPVAKRIDAAHASRLPTSEAVPVVTPISFAGAGMAAAAAVHWRQQAKREQQRQPPSDAPRSEPQPAAPAPAQQVLPLYRESLEQLSDLHGFRRSLEDRLEAYGLERAATHAGSSPSREAHIEELEQPQPVEEPEEGSETSNGSIREFLEQRRQAATRIQRTYRGGAARRSLSRTRPDAGTAHSEDRFARDPDDGSAAVVVEDLDDVRIDDDHVGAPSSSLPPPEPHRYDDASDSNGGDDSNEESSESSASGSAPPARPKRPVGRWAGGAVGTGAPAALTRLQRPAGKIQWVASIWRSLERCVALLDNS
eukprot:COSAG06_NODE_9567_length_1869_cov_1.588701_1_plen_391_part_10